MKHVSLLGCLLGMMKTGDDDDDTRSLDEKAVISSFSFFCLVL